MPRLVVESGIDKGMLIDLVMPKTTVGRSANNDHQIIDKRMSRHHVEFLLKEGQLILADLGSKNGTYLNNVRVTGQHVLSDQDRIRIGETVLLIERPAEENLSASQSGPGSEVEFVEADWMQSPRKNKTIAAGLMPIELKDISSGVKVPAEPAASGAADPSPFEEKAKQLEIFFAVADAVRTILDLEKLLERIMEIIWESLDPDNGVILLNDEQTNQLYPVISRSAERDARGKVVKIAKPPEGTGIAVSRSIINQSMSERVCILMADNDDQRFQGSESVIMNKIKAAICSPIINKDEILGVVYVDSNSKFSSFTAEQQEMLAGIANQAAMAISNVKLHERLVRQQKLEKEMEIARTIQMNLLPKSYPELSNFEIAAMSLPAKQVGGDYYDFVELPDGRWGMAIADVSGKGVPAALLTTTVRAAMLAFAPPQKLSPPAMMSALNAVTYRDSLNNMFVTMVYAVIDDAGRTITFTNAGHAHPFILRPDGSETPLIEGGCFLGIDEEMEYDHGSVSVEAGSVLVLYTDGVTDAANEEDQHFGNERFKAVVRQNIDKPAQEILDAVYQATLAFRGTAEQFDDFTLIVCKCTQ